MLVSALRRDTKETDGASPSSRPTWPNFVQNKIFAEPASAKLDAFVLLGLVPPFADTWEEQVACRRGILHNFQTDMERYVFLLDLKATNYPLFDAILEQDDDLVIIFSEVPLIAPDLASVNYSRRPRPAA